MGMINLDSENSYYQKSIYDHRPGLIMILLDQSLSMMDCGKSKIAANAVNRVIYEIQCRCQSGNTIKDRCYIGVIGYGKSISPIIGGMISEVADIPTETTIIEGMEIPVWVEPKAENTTPMAQAFEQSYNLLKDWVSNHKDCFPPIVMNVSDGAPDDYDEITGNALRTRDAAKKIMTLETDDGKVLMFNAHISGLGKDQMIQLLSNPSEISDEYARFLFSISSVIPDPLLERTERVGLSSKQGDRGLIYNAKTKIIANFFSFGSMWW